MPILREQYQVDDILSIILIGALSIILITLTVGLDDAVGLGAVRDAGGVRGVRAAEPTPASEGGDFPRRRQGRPHGRPPTAARQAAEIRRLASQQMNQSEIARRLGIGRTSVRRILAAKS